jgi:hypothetical protein
LPYERMPESERLLGDVEAIERIVSEAMHEDQTFLPKRQRESALGQRLRPSRAQAT